MTRTRGDRGEVLVAALLRFGLVVGLPAVLCLDVGQLAYARFSTADQAAVAARAASAQWQRSGDVLAAYAAAGGALPDRREAVEPDSFSIARDGTVSLTLARTLHPVLLSRLGTPRSWTHLRESGRAGPPS